MNPAVLNVHTPTSSFAILHSLTEGSITDLYDKLSRRTHSQYNAEPVGPGWLKYEYNGSIWNLDDDSDYAIFTWRQREVEQAAPDDHEPEQPVASTSQLTLPDGATSATASVNTAATSSSVLPTPTIHLHNPASPLPDRTAYCNPSYYIFQPSQAHHWHPPPSEGTGTIRRAPSQASRKSNKTGGGSSVKQGEVIPKLKKDFQKFHAENGVRTVMGSIGPVENVRMLLKAGHRHVYISRKFAKKHGFIPRDSAPGNYGYAGLLSIGEWPITLTPSASSPPRTGQPATGDPRHTFPPPTTHSFVNANAPPPISIPQYSPYSSPRTYNGPGSTTSTVIKTSTPSHMAGSPSNGTYSLPYSQKPQTQSIRSSTGSTKKDIPSYEHTTPKNGLKPVMVEVYLSEEPHFDVVLGRSFFEKRLVKINVADPTDVWCLDTGEKIECELVILKDGKGEIVTVT